MKKLWSIGCLMFALGFVFMACEDNGFVPYGNFSGNGALVDGNGLPIGGATVYIPNNNPVALTSDPLALTGSGGECEDPSGGYSAADCTTTSGVFNLPCPSTVVVEIAGIPVYEFLHECSSNGENVVVVVPEVFEEPLAFVPLAGDVFDFMVGELDESKLSIIDTLTNTLDSTLSSGFTFTIVDKESMEVPAYVVDVATAPNGDAVISAMNTYAGIGLGGLGFSEEPGKIFIVDSETNAISEIIIEDFFPINVSVSPDGSKAYVTGSFYPPFFGIPPLGLGGIGGEVIPAPLGIIDLDNGVEVGQILLPPLFTNEMTDMNLLMSTDVAFTPDGSQAIASSILFTDDCDEGTLGPCVDIYGSFYYVLNPAFNIITDVGELSTAGGEIAINNGKAYIVASDLLFSLLDLGVEEGALMGIGECESIDIYDFAEEETNEPFSLKGGCAFSAVSSPTKNEVYLGLFSKGTYLATMDTVEDDFVDEPVYLEDEFDVTPTGLGVPPDGNSVYILYAEGEGESLDCGGPLYVLEYDLVADELLNDDPILIEEDSCSIGAEPLSLSVQGISN